jgi:hypothetical protein
MERRTELLAKVFHKSVLLVALLGMVVLLVLSINQSKLLPWRVMGVGKCR